MKGRNMATILVDYENVGNINGLRGVDVLKREDTLIIFFSDNCKKIRADYMQYIKESECRFRVVKLKKAGKNGLDFYIATECGVISERGEKQIAIISNDKGFQAVIDFFCRDKEAGNPQIVKAANIENALTLFSNQEDSVRRKFLLSRMMPLDLAEESTNLEEQERVKRNLQVILTGTQYEGKMEEIIRFMSQKGKKRRKEIYTGALHQFGRKDGVEIYRLLKKGLESDVGADESGRR